MAPEMLNGRGWDLQKKELMVLETIINPHGNTEGMDGWKDGWVGGWMGWSFPPYLQMQAL